MKRVLVIKTGALGDVLRTTAILPGLASWAPGLELVWLTAQGAEPLVERHPQVARVVSVDPKDAASVEAAGAGLAAGPWDWILSLDDEEPLCRLASTLHAASPGSRLSGAYQGAEGRRSYTDDVAPWFDMGLLSRLGKAAADRLKIQNQRTHPALYASMLGLEEGRPSLPLTEAAEAHARTFRALHDFDSDTHAIGLNTGAGGRWTSKGLPVERVLRFAAELGEELHRARGWRPVYVVLGGPAERERNVELLAGLAEQGTRAVDGGVDNGLLEFAALLELLDLLVTSDSLALHLGAARDVPIVAFFAPTSAAEIELYGLGEKVASTAPDACSYRRDADNNTLTVERLVAAALRTLARAAHA